MRKKRELTPLETAKERFHEEHSIYMSMIGECEFGDHVDVVCSCGFEVRTYGSSYDLVNHVVDSILGGLFEPSTV